MFIVSLTYHCSMSEIEKFLPAHIAYLDRHYAANNFLISGRKNPRTGGVIIAVTETLQALNTILDEDPFKVNNLASYTITEFIPSKVSSNIASLL